MKKLLLFVTMTASLLFTQCKKDDKNSMPSEGKTVSMTVTAGPGSKTDITPNDGAITWSKDDKLYVGDGSKYIGYLTLKSGEGSATGVFSGNVTLDIEKTEVDDSSEDGGQTFHFFYLGNAKDYTGSLKSDPTSVEVDFSSQNIYKNGNKLENASAQHVGYGKANGTVVGNVVTDINVMMVSKVAIAHFSFKKGAAYTGALTLKGDNICNKMTVNFNSAEFACEGTKGGISLTNETTPEKYVMLVPTSGTTTSQTLTFVGEDVEGTATLENGILPNKFYGKDDAIAVTLEASTPKFSVAKGNYVEFASGNLYYDGTDEKWKFEANQWDYSVGDGSYDEESGMVYYDWNPTHVSHFFWSKDAKEAVKEKFYWEQDMSTEDKFFTDGPSFTVDGETDVWRTLNDAEWNYLLSINAEGEQQEGYGRKDALSLSKWSAVTFDAAGTTTVKGLIIMPDRYDYNTTPLTDGEGTTSYSRWQTLEAAGAVFLPASGYRIDTDVYDVGRVGFYWLSTPPDEDYAHSAYFASGYVFATYSGLNSGNAVRLVR